MYATKVLMVRPNGFRVEYAINPYMKNDQGELNQVDLTKAQAQWAHLKQTFERLGLRTEIIEGQPEYPDMVFCANQTLPLPLPSGDIILVLSRMKSPHRQGEVPAFADWAKKKGIPTFSMTDFVLEGAGDGIYANGKLFAGYGFRSERKAFDLLAQRFGVDIVPLQLVSPHFYHLDTCFTVLNETTMAYVPEAFHPESRSLLESHFSTRLVIDSREAKQFFAGNGVCVDGRHIVLPSGADHYKTNLQEHGFVPVEVDTSEFIKAGGSVFCMKQLLPF